MIYAFWIALLEEKCISYDKNNPMQWGEIRPDRQEKKIVLQDLFMHSKQHPQLWKDNPCAGKCMFVFAETHRS